HDALQQYLIRSQISPILRTAQKADRSIHRSSADVRFPPKPHEGRGCSGLRKKYRNIFEYIPIAYGVVAVEMIARASLAPSKMLNTTLKKQFLDIARSAL